MESFQKADTLDERPMLVVDGNSLLHRSYYALESTNMRTDRGDPSWALYGFWNQLCQIVNRVNANSVLIGFDASTNFRFHTYSEYKAGRSKKPEDLVTQIKSAPNHFANAGLHVVKIEGYEADDVVASAAQRNSAAGINTVIATSDKDAFSLVRENSNGTVVSVLRVINGGISSSPLLTPERLETLVGIPGTEYRLYAAMRGDKSDNLPGVVGVGEKTAVKLIEGLKRTGATMEDVLADLDSGGTLLLSLIGPSAAKKFANPVSRANFVRNLSLMKQSDILDVGSIPVTKIPLQRSKLLQELRFWQMKNVMNVAANTLTDPSNIGFVPKLEPVSVEREPDLFDLLF